MSRLPDQLNPPAIFEQQKLSKFICTECGGARDCACTAPAREREAARKEAQRQADARYAEKRKEKRQQKQRPVDIDTNDAEASAEQRKAEHAARDNPPKPEQSPIERDREHYRKNADEIIQQIIQLFTFLDTPEQGVVLSRIDKIFTIRLERAE